MSDTVETKTLEESIGHVLKTVEEGAVALRAKAVSDFERTWREQLAGKLEPDRRMVAAMNDAPKQKDTVPAFSGARILDPRQHLYERIKRSDPQLAEFRTPDADHWSAEWIRGMTFNDHARSNRASDEIAKLYGRATFLEGTTTAGSGLSPGEGGFFVPLPLAASIQLYLNKAAKVRSLCSVFQSSAKTLRVPISNKATALMKLENSAAAQGEPDMTSLLLDKKKMQAQFGASKETLRDSAFDLAGFFSERAGSAFGELEDVEICTAASTPTVTNAIGTVGAGAFTEFTEGVAGTMTWQDVVNQWYSLADPYQANATWLCSGPMASMLTRMVAATIGPVLTPVYPMVTIGDAANVQGTIFGRPVVIVPLAVGTLWVGDVRRGYAILDEPGVEVESSTHVGWSTDTVLWKFTRRFDGGIMVGEAARPMLGITTLA